MDERAAFIRAIAAAWGDPTPVLVYADWAEERGLDNPTLLRWYANKVMPAVAAVPGDCGPGESLGRSRWGRVLRPHPQAEVLYRLAAVAFCRRPCVWGILTGPPNPKDPRGGEHAAAAIASVVVARLYAIGLASVRQRQDADRNRSRCAVAAAAARDPDEDDPAVFAGITAGDAAGWVTADRASEAAHYAALHARNAACYTALAKGTDRFEAESAEYGYQQALYRALSRIPMIPRED